MCVCVWFYSSRWVSYDFFQKAFSIIYPSPVLPSIPSFSLFFHPLSQFTLFHYSPLKYFIPMLSGLVGARTNCSSHFQSPLSFLSFYITVISSLPPLTGVQPTAFHEHCDRQHWSHCDKILEELGTTRKCLHSCRVKQTVITLILLWHACRVHHIVVVVLDRVLWKSRTSRLNTHTHTSIHVYMVLLRLAYMIWSG